MRNAGLIAGVLAGVVSGIIGGAATVYFMLGGNVQAVLSGDLGTTITTAQRSVQETSATTQVVEEASPSVVSIVVSKELQQQPDLYNRLFGGSAETTTEEVEIASGTGFIVSEDGMILTNRHVVSEEGASYTVVFDDGETIEAEVLARDKTTDLAILDIDKKGLTPLELSDSDELVVGQAVLAIGNTLGEYSNTVTKGIVSGLARNLGGQYSGLIQTDAAINSGNSGGPLLNLDGQVVGINTAVDRSGEGIGFAIPINDVKAAVQSVQETGRIVRAGLGVRYLELTPDIAELNGVEYDYGAYIRGTDVALGVIPNSAADKAGLSEGDIILSVDGTDIDADNTLANLMRGYAVGDQVELRVFKDGEEQTITVTLDELPENSTGGAKNK